MVIKKRDLAKKLADKNGLTTELSLSLINDFIELIKEEVKDGNEVVIRKFGSIKMHEFSSRVGNDFKSMDRIMIPAKKAAKFKVSDKF